MSSYFTEAYAAIERHGLRFLLGQRSLRRLLAGSRSAVVEGRTLDEGLAAMLRLDDIARRSALTGRTPQGARRRLRADVLVTNPPSPGEVTATELAANGPAGPIPLRRYASPGLAAPSPGIVYLHGGGWVTGGLDTHDGPCRWLATRARCVVLSVDYRLAPEHPFPAAVEDAVAAVRWVLSRAEALGLDPARIAVVGDSAGGNLAAVVSRRLEGDARRPALQVLLYPALDATCAERSHTTLASGYFLTRANCDWYYDHYLGTSDRRHPDASPLLAPGVSTVPALVYTCGFDPLRDEGARFAERLRAAGTRVELHEFADLTHGFLLMSLLPRAHEATERVMADIARTL